MRGIVSEVGADEATDARSPVEPGLYEHYKGNRYRVIGTVRHSETEEVLVLYRALYGERGAWVRPLAMFTGTVRRAGATVQRFARIDD